MTNFDDAYNKYVQQYVGGGNRSHIIHEVLMQLSILAGLVYDPEQDQDMDEILAGLSTEAYVLNVINSFSFHHHMGRENHIDIVTILNTVSEVLGDIPKTNHTKILGWIRKKAKERGCCEI